MTLKLNGSTSGSVALDAPAATTSGADITFKLPIADGSAGQVLSTDGSGNLSWITPQKGIVVDRWRNTTTEKDTDHWVIDTWERPDTANCLPGNKLEGGSGMSESSGIFTFPSTGIWEVQLVATCAGKSGTDNLWMVAIWSTTDNGSNWTQGSYAAGGTDGVEWSQGYASQIMDITDTSNQKVYFRTDTFGYHYLRGSTDDDTTHATFFRWGDT